MRIERIETIPVALPYHHDGPLTGFGGTMWKTLDYLLVKVSTSDGLVGWGEAFGYNVIPATRVAIDKIVAPMAIGRDSSDISGLMEALKRPLHLFGRSGPVQYALGGLDIALWDLAGKRAGQSIATLLGGARRDSIPAYTSLMKLGEAKIIVHACERALQRGYRHLKLHETTVQAVAAARSALGPDIHLMVDVNCAWRATEAIDMAKRMAAYQPAWLEEPVWPPEDIEGLDRVGEASGVPLAAGENIANAWSFKPLLASRSLHYLQPSVTKVGGISEFMQVAMLAEMHGRVVAPHSPYFGPGLLATLQLAAACPVIDGIERFGVELEASLYGDCGTARADGTLSIPRGPGLGLDPDPEVIARCRID